MQRQDDAQQPADRTVPRWPARKAGAVAASDSAPAQAECDALVPGAARRSRQRSGACARCRRQRGGARARRRRQRGGARGRRGARTGAAERRSGRGCSRSRRPSPNSSSVGADSRRGHAAPCNPDNSVQRRTPYFSRAFLTTPSRGRDEIRGRK